jgi:hypothetical protein
MEEKHSELVETMPMIFFHVFRHQLRVGQAHQPASDQVQRVRLLHQSICLRSTLHLLPVSMENAWF